MFFSNISVFLNRLENIKKFTIYLNDNTYFYEKITVFFIKKLKTLKLLNK